MSQYLADVPNRLIVMARYPEAGRTKTRLIPALGPDGAAALHKTLVRQTLRTADALTDAVPCAVEIRFAGGDAAGMQQLFGDRRTYLRQEGDCLGDRMSLAAAAAFTAGAGRVVVIGTDCPSLTASHLTDAFIALRTCDVVLGPARDGGYYLIGMRRHLPELFHDVDWGTASVREQTLRNALRISASVRQLEILSDVDFPQDLLPCRRSGHPCAAELPRTQADLVSVIIPTLNEENSLPATLRSLQESRATEVIVCDGGSTDRTCAAAESCGATVLRCGRGRGLQLNAGAAVARGEFLLFLHADARLPNNFGDQVRSGLAGTGAGGAFQLRIDHSHPLLRLVEFGTRLRSRWLQLPYGDQAVFLRAETFYTMGGFREQPLMEDYEFCRRLSSHGRIILLDSAVTVSARRWLRLGIVRTTLLNQFFVAAWYAGVSPARLAKWYGR